MRKVFIAVATGAIMALLLMVSGNQLHAQGNNCNEGRAIGLAHSQLNSCAASLGADWNLNWNASPNNLGGYTVYVSGAPKCPPGNICPLIIILVGSVVIDADCNVVEVNCGFGN